VSTLNRTVRKFEAVERSYIVCVCVCGLCKSVQYWPLEEQESALATWRKQAHAWGIFVADSVMGEKALHIAADLGVGSSAGSVGRPTSSHFSYVISPILQILRF
jgi:hypothetical protein